MALASFTKLLPGDVRFLSKQEQRVIKRRLSALLEINEAVNNATGFDWIVSSYFRDSPSHKKWGALDLAPLVAVRDRPKYAFYAGQDPSLDLRPVLFRRLSRAVKSIRRNFPFDFGIFIENDHLHVQLFERTDASAPRIGMVCKWGKPNPLYLDSAARRDRIMKLSEEERETLFSNVIDRRRWNNNSAILMHRMNEDPYRIFIDKYYR